MKKIIYLDRFGTVGGVGRANVELLAALSKLVSTYLQTPPCHVQPYVERLAGTDCNIQALYRIDSSRFLDPVYWLEKYKVLDGSLSALYLKRAAAHAEANLLVNYPQIYAPPRRTRVKFAVLIYDLNWRVFPGNFPDPEMIDKRCRRWIELADKVFTISEVTRNEILEFYGTEPTKVISAPLAHFSPRLDTIKENTGPWEDSDYWLYPAAMAEHKGHDLLAEALLTGEIHHPVVLTCRMPDVNVSAYQAKLLPIFKKLIAENKLRVTGYTNEDEYASVIRNAKGYLLPSRYEGYGLPLVEALAVGKPVVASDITAFREICKRYDCDDAVATFTDGDVNSMIAAIQQVVARSESPPVVDLNTWTWKQTAERIVQGFE